MSSYFVHMKFASPDYDWCFSAEFPLTLLFSFPVRCNVQTRLRANHIWQKLCILLKRTPESHWFTPQQTVIFHSLPQRSLRWQNTSLMCSYEIKCFPQAINHSTPLPFISLHQITWLLAKWTAPPTPPREMYCIYFLWTNCGWFIFPRTLCF